MGIHKSYFEKNNVIQYSSSGNTRSLINTAKNEIVQMYYGYDIYETTIYSRYLFNIDLTSLIEKYENKTFIPDGTERHVLKLVNTGNFDNELLGTFDSSGRLRTSSFDLELFKIEEEWDEGVGYDFFDARNLYPDETTFSTAASNWYYRQGVTPWAQPGVYSGSSSAVTITSQHFDNGNENIELDITATINDILTGATTGITGFGLAFSREFETLTGISETYYVGFYSKYAKSFYEPYLETTFNDIISDDRNKFCLNKTNRLYLYFNKNGLPTNLDYLPTVLVYDHNGAHYRTFSSTEVKQQTKGVYYIEFAVTGTTYPELVSFTDIWTSLSIDGNNIPDKTQEFVTVCQDDCYETEESYPVDWSMAISGIGEKEKIKIGDIRRVYLTAQKPFSFGKPSLIDECYYRVYIKQGGTHQYDVIPWAKFSKTNKNMFFTLDTNILIPQVYHMDIKFNSGGETKVLHDKLTFTIESEVSTGQ